MADQICDRVSRRTALLAAVSAFFAVGAVSRTARGQQAPPQKVDPKTALYQPFPKNGQSCNKCVNFEPPTSCKLVAGTISPAGWCQLFAAKPS